MKKLRRILPIIGIAIFIYLILKLDIKEIISTVASIDVFLLVLALILIIPIVVLQSLKWYLILKEQGINLNFNYLIRLQLISTFYGFITPGRVGSLIKILYLKEKANKTLGEATSSVILDRLLDLVIVVTLAVIGGFFLMQMFPGMFWKMAIFLLILVILIYIFISKKRSEFIIKFLHRFLVPKKYKDKALESYDHFYDALIHPKKLILPFLVTLMVWVTIYSQAYIIATALSVKIPYFNFITIFPISTVIGLIPITVGGLGTREAALISLFSVYGVESTKIFTTAIVWLLSSIITTVIGGILSIKEEKVV